MDAYQTIISKRDRREYLDRPIEDAIVQRILQAGRMAGTASNRQPLRFIVLRDQAQKQRLAPAGPGTAPLVRAPLAVLILRQSDTGMYAPFDAGRAAQNMMLAAWAEGIYSCPVGLREPELLKEVLGLPDDQVVVVAIAFGYPDPDAQPRESRPRLAMDEMVHLERW